VGALSKWASLMPLWMTSIRASATPRERTRSASTAVTGSTASAARHAVVSAHSASRNRPRPPKRWRSSTSGALTSSNIGMPLNRRSIAPASRNRL
jgi:hypothetical protein